MRRGGFTLIEMMISITLFSVIMVFLYQAVATIDKSNRFYTNKLSDIEREQLLLKTLYLDLTLSVNSSGIIDNVNYKEDRVFLQTSHVVHDHMMPFVVYFLENKHLYRVETVAPLSYPFESNINAKIDDFGEVEKFRLYKNSTHFLLDIKLNGEENLLKIRHLNAK